MVTAHHRQQPARRRRKGSGYPVQDLRQRALAWAVKLRVNPRVIRVQDMRHKWGSCTSQGTVTLAHDLVDRSDEFQDYVIVHELLHMRYANHGRVFKALMSAYVPGWQSMEHQRLTSSIQKASVSAQAPNKGERRNVKSPHVHGRLSA